MDKNNIKNIVFSPQSYSLQEIKEMAKDAINRKLLASVFGDRLFANMLSIDNKLEFSEGGLYNTNQKSNLVVFWGMPHSGRTSAIFSLLAQKGFRIKWPINKILSNRIAQILGLFRSKKEVFVPDLSKEEVSEIYHTTYKSWFWGRSYNISFLKPQKGCITTEVRQLLVESQDQIHVFCIDCCKDNGIASNVDSQITYINNVIKYLENYSFLQQSNAIYLMVMKSDLMNVPDIYEENAAQTFVTSGMPDFWHQIQELSYDKNIENVQPIVFSIGNFILKDYTRLDADYSKLFLEECLLPKCQPNQNFLEKLLSKGKAKYSPILFALLLLLVGWGIYHVWNAIVSPPVLRVVPFDYAKGFIDEEVKMKSFSYEDATKTYQTLRTDLNTEQSLRQFQGGVVLSDSIRQQCDSILTNDYSAILFKELEKLFGSKNWTESDSRLRKVDAHIVELVSHHSLKEKDLNTYHTYIHNYFYSIKPLFWRSGSCKSVQDARVMASQANQWKKAPYNKDAKLMIKLSEVRANAYCSCSDYYLMIANNRIRMNDALRREYKSRNESLASNIGLLISDIRYDSDYRLVANRRLLENVRKNLMSIYQ